MAMRDHKPVAYLLQGLNYSLFIAVLAYFSNAPAYRQLADNEAVITIAFSHAGLIREPCRTLGAEELAQLAPNMRKPVDCPRERSPIIIETMLDGQVLYNHTAHPPGLYSDGGVSIYHTKTIPIGEHRLTVKMDDSIRSDGFEYSFEQDLTIQPAQIILVNFLPEQGFSIR